MDALGQLVIAILTYGIWVSVILIACIVGVIYNLVKYPKESSRALKSFGSATLIVVLMGYLTKSLWLDLETKAESSTIGIFGSLILILIIGYLLNRYFQNKTPKPPPPNRS